jgi:thiol-disulfide isomerase/thioredoxin
MMRALRWIVPPLLGAATTSVGAAQPVTLAPLFAASGGWLNGTPTPQSLAGKVVVVDVFTVDCINCQNVTPNLRKLNSSEPGVRVIGVHTPETRYEKDRTTVVASLKRLGVVWPVAIDNDSKLWNAYGVVAWPTELIFDRHGHLRKTVIGDSQDAELDAAVTELLAEP